MTWKQYPGLLSIILLLATGCAVGPVERGLPSEQQALKESPAQLVSVAQQLPNRVEKNGFTFETEVSSPSRLTLRSGSKIALLHDDRDEADKHVRLLLEQAIFAIKAAHPSIVIVERRSVKDLLREHKFQLSGLVRDQDLARIGHFLGLDYVAVFDTSNDDLNELYGLNNRIDTWEVLIQMKIIDVNTAELVFTCSPTTRVIVGRTMRAAEVRALNREALTVAAKSTSFCLTRSLDGRGNERQ
ncbi:MAG: hypothetical protein ACREIQ_09540 [Nitrospiria bacterium]